MTASGGSGQPIVLRLSGDVDALTQAEYRRTADELLTTSSADRLVVDLSEVTTIDSSGLGLLVHLQALTRENGVTMVLTHVPPRAGALLKRTGLDRVFEIDAS
ncbi:MAG TPA: STAS domain-containing protein [Jatrophihabitans sp.]|jgi:anti-anti-sigma factor